MSCCTPIITQFVNATLTTIPFGDSQKTIYGDVPTVKILYYEEGEFRESTGFLTQVKLEDDQLTVNHGGPATGIIKVN